MIGKILPFALGVLITFIAGFSVHKIVLNTEIDKLNIEIDELNKTINGLTIGDLETAMFVSEFVVRNDCIAMAPHLSKWLKLNIKESQEIFFEFKDQDYYLPVREKEFKRALELVNALENL